jgi:hypothetical protein
MRQMVSMRCDGPSHGRTLACCMCCHAAVKVALTPPSQTCQLSACCALAAPAPGFAKTRAAPHHSPLSAEDPAAVGRLAAAAAWVAARTAAAAAGQTPRPRLEGGRPAAQREGQGSRHVRTAEATASSDGCNSSEDHPFVDSDTLLHMTPRHACCCCCVCCCRCCCACCRSS